MRFILFSVLFSTSVFAQYLETELSAGDLDPNKPVIKEMGTPPKTMDLTNVDESRRNIDGVKREPAVVNDGPITNTVGK